MKPILFTTDMVRAILDGRKTMTRRVMKRQPLIDPQTGDWMYRCSETGAETVHSIELWISKKKRSPYGGVGDTIWVRETWTPLDVMEGESDEDENGDVIPAYSVEFGFKDRDSNWGAVNEEYYNRMYDLIDEMEQGGTKWKPSIHMPKSACRLFLEITDVRVERLQDIIEADAIAEGIQTFSKDGTVIKYGLESWKWVDMPRTLKDSFQTLWQSINGPESWDANPWVWVISFKQINQHENRV